MLKTHCPSTVAPPFSNYSHGVEAPPGARWLYISGQVGVDGQGNVAAGFEDQAERAWRNVIAILDAADMDLGDVVRFNTYLTRAEDVAGARRVRDRFIEPGDHAPASTLVVIAALAAPDWLFEMEAVAAKV